MAGGGHCGYLWIAACAEEKECVNAKLRESLTVFHVFVWGIADGGVTGSGGTNDTATFTQN